VPKIRIISAEPLPQCRLKVTFNDGVSGVSPVEPERRGGVFLKLLDARVFNALTVNPDFGCVEWPGGVELRPSRAELRAAPDRPQLTVAAALHDRRFVVAAKNMSAIEC